MNVLNNQIHLIIIAPSRAFPFSSHTTAITACCVVLAKKMTLIHLPILASPGQREIAATDSGKQHSLFSLRTFLPVCRLCYNSMYD
ncbi:unnamed protein product, partial [Ectocarpus sp. 8 AP-2014]